MHGVSGSRLWVFSVSRLLQMMCYCMRCWKGGVLVAVVDAPEEARLRKKAGGGLGGGRSASPPDAAGATVVASPRSDTSSI